MPWHVILVQSGLGFVLGLVSYVIGYRRGRRDAEEMARCRATFDAYAQQMDATRKNSVRSGVESPDFT